MSDIIHASLVHFARPVMLCGAKAENLHVWQWGRGKEVTCKRCLSRRKKERVK